MFKYGSIRIFFIKISIGIISIAFSIIFIGSLLSFSENDPGFNKFANSEIDMAISNNFGLFGSYLSSYSFVFVGVLSYIIGVFIGIQGLKSFLGFKNSFYILRFIANIFGILFVSMFLFNYGAETLNTGLLATFLSELSYQILFSKIQNDYVLYFINLLIFVLAYF